MGEARSGVMSHFASAEDIERSPESKALEARLLAGGQHASLGGSPGGSGKAGGFWGQLTESTGLARPLKVLDLALEEASELGSRLVAKGKQAVAGGTSVGDVNPTSAPSVASATSISSSSVSSSSSSSSSSSLEGAHSSASSASSSVAAASPSSGASRCMSVRRRCRVHDGKVDEAVCWPSATCTSARSSSGT